MAQVAGVAQVAGPAQVAGVAQVAGPAQVAGVAQVAGPARVAVVAQVAGVAQVAVRANVAGVAQVAGVDQVRPTKGRKKIQCPLCAQEVFHLLRHLRGKIHALDNKAAVTMAQNEKQQSSAKNAMPLKQCPVPKCFKRIQRVVHHLINTHGFKREGRRFQRCMLRLLPQLPDDHFVYYSDDIPEGEADGRVPQPPQPAPPVLPPALPAPHPAPPVPQPAPPVPQPAPPVPQPAQQGNESMSYSTLTFIFDNFFET